MIIMFGTRMYGKVDRVPGLCYVTTTFAYLNFLPLFPTGSFLVIEGSEAGGEVRGKPFGLSLKSVLAGYLRVWGGVAAVLCLTVGGVVLFGEARRAGVDAGVVGAVGFGVMAAAGLVALLGAGRAALLAVVVALAAGGVLGYAVLDAAGPNGKPAAAGRNLLAILAPGLLGLTLAGLTRAFDHAGPGRRAVLMAELGIDPDRLAPPDDDHDPRPDRDYEPWDEAEDRRGRSRDRRRDDL